MFITERKKSLNFHLPVWRDSDPSKTIVVPNLKRRLKNDYLNEESRKSAVHLTGTQLKQFIGANEKYNLK